MESEEKMIKTGTTTVGIVCKDGVVMAADKRSSAGYMVANRKQEKLVIINETIAVAQAGLVSDAQLLSKLLTAELKLKDIRTGRASTVTEGANLLAGMLYSNIRKPAMFQSIVGFLLGGVDNHGNHLFELGIDGSITKSEEFASDGSGSVYALGVLETLYRKDMSMDEGIDLAFKAINAALKRDIATGNGIDVVTITKDGAKKIITKELEYTINR
ncbi:proteasome subunit beta [Candidatus Woesearchaeota archaeon CG11_big_fil_rev_8_21_14_0_20_43_8]|nr:MAG: proteasome subunit beta [Candidatus Woesearchaeota archaeon CG11_big_fil_rev_8_21_14_0_20_43_8]PIO04837.1 MAG: proteasome subunit beta [Candidatus Woesearchaeota archaeon CG08_land_8_20_14_0_20_43_7]